MCARRPSISDHIAAFHILCHMLIVLYPSTMWAWVDNEYEVWSNVRMAGPAICVILTLLASSFCTTQQQEVPPLAAAEMHPMTRCRRPNACRLEVNVTVSIWKPKQGKLRLQFLVKNIDQNRTGNGNGGTDPTLKIFWLNTYNKGTVSLHLSQSVALYV